MSHQAPELITERLRLRGFAPEDFDWYADFWQQPQIIRFIGGKVRSRNESWMRFCMNFGMWEIAGYGFWMIVDRDDTDIRLGMAGLFRGERGIPRLDAHPEAGWALAPHAFGRGIAAEAMTAALAWSDAHLDAPRTGCIIEPENLASIRIAERLGYAGSGEAKLGGDAVTVYSRPRGG